MNNNQERKKGKRNSSSSPFNININSDYIYNQNINNPNHNTQLINPNYVNRSIYSGKSLNYDINEINQCPNCLSYQQKLKEKNLIIQKLQNQISRLNTSISSSNITNMKMNEQNRQLNNYKKIISDLKNELSQKDEEILNMKFNYDEPINDFISKNNELQKELSDLKRHNIILNKKNNNLQKIINNKDDEIYKYKEKVQALLNTINVKNESLNKLKEESKNKIDDLENKYINLSSNYNTLALSSGGSKLINYDAQKAKTNNDSIDSKEEDNLADILINTGKLTQNKSSNNIDLIKSKSQKLYYDSGSENNIKNLKKKCLIKKGSITPKMSSTQSSWMISSIPHELQILQRDFENIKNKLDFNIQENKKLNQKIIINNEQLKKIIEENKNIKDNINDLLAKNNVLNKTLNEKTNNIIRYQRECFDKNNQIEKLKSLLLSKSKNSSKIPCPSTISSSKRHDSNKNLYQKNNKTSSNNIRDFSEYDHDYDNFTDEKEYSNKILSYKGNSQDMIEISDKDEIESKKEQTLKMNKSSSCLKKNIKENNVKYNKKISSDSNKDKDIQINLLTQKLNEKIKTINSFKLKMNELQNQYKSLDEITLLKNELENKLKIINKENNELSKKLETKNNLINDYESKLKDLKIIIEEKDLIIQKKEEDISNSEKGNQDFEKIISQMEKTLLSYENINKEQ